jgi:rare lipoprotein A
MTVRVNDRGPFVGGRIIDLSHAAAQELGYDRAGIAHVRVRYVGPAPLAGPDAGVRYAKAKPSTTTPTAARRPADEDIFQDAASAPVAPKPLVAPAEAVSVSALAPLPAALPAREATVAEQPSTSAQVYRIQAGAFSDQDNARRAVAQLAGTGTATIEPFRRGGTTLYRVVLPGPEDEAEAYSFRDKVIAIGFADARVLRP